MISIVMPAHNEEGYLEPAVKSVVTGLSDRGIPFELIIVENGSSDGTDRVARELSENYGEVRSLRLPEANYGLALREGFLASIGEIIVNFDVDLVDLGFLDRALSEMNSTGVVVLVGSKRGPGADDQRALGRKIITAVFSSILRHGFGLTISDTHGLKALRRETLIPVVSQCQFGADIFDTELILRAERAGLEIAEVPVVVSEMRPARTSVLRRIPRTVLGLIRLRLVIGRTSTT